MEREGTDLGIERILIVGVGVLGVPAALKLGRTHQPIVIGLLDAENVELSNLARQVIYHTADVGKPKVLAAAHRLTDEFPALILETMQLALDSTNARKISAEYDVVIDGTDDPRVKFLINDMCVVERKPFAYGGVLSYRGQVMTVIPGRTACLRCLFEEPPDDADSASCRDAGIIGPIAGAIGSIQASEAIACLAGETPRLAGRMLTYDANSPVRIRIVEVSPRAGCVCGAAGSGVAQTASEPRKNP